MFSYIRHSFLCLHNIISSFYRFVKFCVYISILTPGISESAFFRLVIENTEIKEKPDENFYRILNDLRGVAVNINQLARVANSYQYVDDNKYYPLANKVNNMVDDLQKFYLTPTKKE